LSDYLFCNFDSFLFYFFQGVPENLETAMRLLREAAAQGFQLSISVLERLQRATKICEEVDDDDDNDDDDADTSDEDPSQPERFTVKLFTSTTKVHAVSRSHDTRLMHLLRCKVSAPLVFEYLVLAHAFLPMDKNNNSLCL
jgi:hypothetical protein